MKRYIILFIALFIFSCAKEGTVGTVSVYENTPPSGYYLDKYNNVLRCMQQIDIEPPVLNVLNTEAETHANRVFCKGINREYCYNEENKTITIPKLTSDFHLGLAYVDYILDMTNEKNPSSKYYKYCSGRIIIVE